MVFRFDARSWRLKDLDEDLGALGHVAPRGYAVGLHIRFAAPTITAHTYPEEWLQIYTEQGYALRDPLIGWGLSTTGAARWSEIAVPDPFGIWQQAREFGLNFGAAISVGPLQSRSIVGISREDREFTAEELATAEQIVARMHLSAQPPAELTKAQAEALCCIADGDRLAAAAYRLGISESALKARLSSVRQRLDVRTLPEAILKAKEYRLI
ncbi:autoinducer binding domain-containing protein [Palleronia rufa]|uniref:autoinducer binding domain-containing protein n=1 Tax=Palleronia rufa TaxID=1530186 RepID=UPI000569D448|nr:autoinducer binding domain-containing protein [Palleronia rufa]